MLRSACASNANESAFAVLLPVAGPFTRNVVPRAQSKEYQFGFLIYHYFR